MRSEGTFCLLVVGLIVDFDCYYPLLWLTHCFPPLLFCRYSASYWKACWHGHLSKLYQESKPLTTDGFQCEFGCLPPRMDLQEFVLKVSPLPMPISREVSNRRRVQSQAMAEEERKFLPTEETYRMAKYFKDESSCPSIAKEREEARVHFAAKKDANGTFQVKGETGDTRSFSGVVDSPAVHKDNIHGSCLTCLDCGKKRLVYITKEGRDLPKDLTQYIVSQALESNSYFCGQPFPPVWLDLGLGNTATAPPFLFGNIIQMREDKYQAPENPAKWRDTIAVRQQLDCVTPIERSLYKTPSLSALLICFYCGGACPPPNARPGWRAVYGMCQPCREGNEAQKIPSLGVPVWGKTATKVGEAAQVASDRAAVQKVARQALADAPSELTKMASGGAMLEADDDNDLLLLARARQGVVAPVSVPATSRLEL